VPEELHIQQFLRQEQQLRTHCSLRVLVDFLAMRIVSALLTGLLLTSAPQVFGQSPPHADLAEAILRENAEGIIAAARALDQAPRVLAAVIFAERSLNVRPAQSMEESLLARCGYNASLGVAQVKMQTADWIERHLAEVSPSAEVAERLAPHLTRSQLIQRLMTPDTNVLYAAAFVALIVKMWAPVLSEPALRRARVGIIATLYSLGLELPDGSLRAPHPDPRMNHFGETAQAFYNGSILREEFSEQGGVL
jgi:hypothetical protein